MLINDTATTTWAAYANSVEQTLITVIVPPSLARYWCWPIFVTKDVDVVDAADVLKDSLPFN